ncbi:MAG: ATP-binding protein [Clostridia bacterium]|nr:ATP-binding protein [Clostridia bacterium]
MNIQQKKDDYKALLEKAIVAFEKNAEPNDICKMLIDVASILIEIGKASPEDKPRCDKKAIMLLTICKKFRENGIRSIAYFALTGRMLPANSTPTSIQEKLNTEAVEGILKQKKTTPCVDVSVRANYQFKWNNITLGSFDDIAGLDDVKKQIIFHVLEPMRNSKLEATCGIKPDGKILLYGPPGTGKTMIAAAIAREIGAKFCSISASDLLLGGNESSEKAITKLFQEARSFRRAVVFFDGIERICPVSTRVQHAKEISSELLRQIQGIDAYGKEGGKILLLIAETNKPWDIDPAFVRPGGFGTRLYVGLPDESTRRYMIESRLNKIKAAGIFTIANDVNIDAIVTATQSFSGADMCNLLDKVEQVSIKRFATGEAKVINQSDFKNVLSYINPSVQKNDLEKLDKWKNENGKSE